MATDPLAGQGRSRAELARGPGPLRRPGEHAPAPGARRGKIRLGAHEQQLDRPAGRASHHEARRAHTGLVEREHVPPALPALLRQHGYRTTVISDFCGEVFSRIDLGFDSWRDASQFQRRY